MAWRSMWRCEFCGLPSLDLAPAPGIVAPHFAGAAVKMSQK
jgi:hypothetical protein